MSAPLTFDEYAKYDALGLAELVARGEVSALELLEVAIERAEAVNPKINAIVLKHGRKVAALDYAKDLEGQATLNLR